MPTLPRRFSLVHQTENILRDEIAAGRWNPRLPSEAELCRTLQVSRTTLRAALAMLTRQKWIRSSQGKRRLVTRGMNPAAVTDVRRVTLITGVPLHLMAGVPMFLLDDLREKLASAGFEVEVHASKAVFAPRPDGALARLVREKPAAAWVLFSATAAIQRWFMARGLPCVLAGSCHPGIVLPTVEVDFYELGSHAARQFFSRGHRRIAALVPALGMAGETKTIDGFLAAARNVSDAQIRVVEHDGTLPNVTRRLEGLLREPAPTGLFIAGSRYAMTAITYLNLAGVKVPRDLSVISRDSEPFVEFVVPPLTRYAINLAQYARRLSRTVVDVAQNGGAQMRNQRILPRFVLGGTLAHLAS